MVRKRKASSWTDTGGVTQGMMRTTVDITFGGGEKADGGTWKPLSTLAYHCVTSVRLPYALVPGLAQSRSATSRWSMITAQRRRERRRSRRVRMGTALP